MVVEQTGAGTDVSAHMDTQGLLQEQQRAKWCFTPNPVCYTQRLQQEHPFATRLRD